MDTTLFKRIHKNKRSISVGRGGTRGKTSGRGTKGQKARSGHKIRPEIRDFIKRLPKLRGRGKNSNRGIVEKPMAVSLAVIEKVFTAGEEINPSTLRLKGLIRYRESSSAPVKILGGEITKKFAFSNVLVSASAKAAIEKAGGSIKLWVTVPTKAQKIATTPAVKKEAKAEPKKEAKKEEKKVSKKENVKKEKPQEKPAKKPSTK
jgi:large subunit ribosomal protein L15